VACRRREEPGAKRRPYGARHLHRPAPDRADRRIGEFPQQRLWRRRGPGELAAQCFRRSSRAMTDATAYASGADKTLLLVDDDAPYRQRLGQAMEKRGFKVIQAESVETAIAAAKAEPPHYAVVDLRLTDGSGLDIVPEIRKVREDC